MKPLVLGAVLLVSLSPVACVGEDDPFCETDTALAQRLRAHGANVSLWLHSGGHGNFGRRMGTYLAFYARALAACGR
jgi:hypothetical protein